MYYGALCGVNIFAIFLSVFVEHYCLLEREELKTYWKISTITLNLIFTCDLILNFFFLGIKEIIKEKKYLLLEILLQLLMLVIYINMFNQGKKLLTDGVSIAMTVYLLRMVRILDFITEIQ